MLWISWEHFINVIDRKVKSGEETGGGSTPAVAFRSCIDYFFQMRDFTPFFFLFVFSILAHSPLFACSNKQNKKGNDLRLCAVVWADLPTSLWCAIPLISFQIRHKVKPRLAYIEYQSTWILILDAYKNFLCSVKIALFVSQVSCDCCCSVWIHWLKLITICKLCMQMHI